MTRVDASVAAKAARSLQSLKRTEQLEALNSLAEALQKSLLEQVIAISARSGGVMLLSAGERGEVVLSVTQHPRTRPSPSAGLESLKRILAKAMKESLSEDTERGKLIRMAVISSLAQLETGSTTALIPRQGAATSGAPDSLLTTAQAAVQLEVSRPYVAMLCDAGKLGEVVITEGKHRRIRQSAVDEYKAAQIRAHEGALSPREAGIEAGLYAHSDARYVKAGQRQSKSSAKASKRSKARSAT
jgi:excisionase family DNA binding protein